MKLHRQQKQKINSLIDSITDTSQKYCYKCAKEQDKLILSSDCKEHNQYFTIAYCPIHKHMQVYRFSKCARCTFEHNGLRVSYCPKCKKDTMHNGKVCMICHPMDIGSKMKYCPICQKVTQHFGKLCAICTGIKNGMRIVYCPVCNKDTKHNGTICTVCSGMKIGFRKGYCNKCKKVTQHVGKKCCICNNIITGAHYTYCDVCKKETLHNSGMCVACHPKALNRPGYAYCSICKRDTGHIGKLCLICHPNITNKPFFIEKYGKRYYKGIEVHQLADDIMSGKRDIKDYPHFNIRFGSVHFKNRDIITWEKHNEHELFTEKDGKRYFKGYEVHKLSKDILSGKKYCEDFPGLNIRFNQVYYLCENIITGKIDKLDYNIKEVNNNRYYKGIEVHQFSQDILTKKKDISNYPGFNIRYGSVHFHTIDIITGSKDPLIRKLQYKHNKLYYNGQLWEQYKKDFISSSKIIHLYNGFWLDTSSNFEQQLIDKNIKWFTYIKFYYKDNKIYPLVVGKTGSKLVNTCGTDIMFRYDYDMRHPGRRLLAEEDLKWVEDKVYIIPTKDEASAYRKECIIASKYNLFMS